MYACRLYVKQKWSAQKQGVEQWLPAGGNECGWADVTGYTQTGESHQFW